MVTATATYLGSLRTICRHEKSNIEIQTDAPTDNNGKGENFSPTDLMATAYISCMLTIIGIHCHKQSLEFNFGKGTVSKKMTLSPRKIGELIIEIDLRNNNWTEEQCIEIKEAAINCPVALSFSENTKIQTNFIFQ